MGRLKDKLDIYFGVIRDEIKALKIIKAEKKLKKNSDSIRVVFITQYIPAWNKVKSLCEKMLKDKRFKVYLLCVPSQVENYQLKNVDDLSNDTYEYYVNNGYEAEAINALVGKNEWFDLQSIEPHYVFCLRPYNHFMPPVYGGESISKHSKLCSILYGPILAKNFYKVELNRGFYRNAYCYFSESKESASYYRKNFFLGVFSGVQKVKFCGMPILESIMNSKDMVSKSWEFAKNDFRVMWTPRWSTSSEIGGSNFFEYKDMILDYAESDKDADLLLRPHPLMFDNFINTGEMTKEEVDEYKNRCASLSNVELDKEKDYIASFWNSSVLLCDYSSIIQEYFVTGKPLIYCPPKADFNYTKQMKKIISVCYVAENKEDVLKYLKCIKEGNDYLAEKRKKMINDLYGDTLYTSTDNIINELLRKI